MTVVTKASLRLGSVFGVFHQLVGLGKSLVALVAGRVRFHFLSELAAWIAAMDFVAGNAGDALAGLARGETFRARHALILVSSQARRSIRPKAGRKTK